MVPPLTQSDDSDFASDTEGLSSPGSCKKNDTRGCSSPSNKDNQKYKFKWLIMEVMESKGIDPNDVSNRLAKMSQPCHGRFTCRNCEGKQWSSSWSWIVVNLRRQIIVYRFHQKCRECLKEATPFLDNHIMREVIEKICDRYLKRIFSDEENKLKYNPNKQEPILRSDSPLPESAKNHKTLLCEKCGYGKNVNPCYYSWIMMRKKHGLHGQ